jgi:hypothetical protein
MQVECTHHIDGSEPDDDDPYSYYYEYDVYCFTEGAMRLWARSYVDTPDERRSTALRLADARGPLLTET